jgi:hypothetical protein
MAFSSSRKSLNGMGSGGDGTDPVRAGPRKVFKAVASPARPRLSPILQRSSFRHESSSHLTTRKKNTIKFCRSSSLCQVSSLFVLASFCHFLSCSLCCGLISVISLHWSFVSLQWLYCLKFSDAATFYSMPVSEHCSLCLVAVHNQT